MITVNLSRFARTRQKHIHTRILRRPRSAIKSHAVEPAALSPVGARAQAATRGARIPYGAPPVGREPLAPPFEVGGGRDLGRGRAGGRVETGIGGREEWEYVCTVTLVALSTVSAETMPLDRSAWRRELDNRACRLLSLIITSPRWCSSGSRAPAAPVEPIPTSSPLPGSRRCGESARTSSGPPWSACRSPTRSAPSGPGPP